MEDLKKNTHGGARKGAGRPKSTRKKTVSITLDQEDIKLFKSIGGSKWLREKLNEFRNSSTN